MRIRGTTSAARSARRPTWIHEMLKGNKHNPTIQPRDVRRYARPRGLSYQTRMVEERIAAAQKAGLFDSLPGKGKPLGLEDLSGVPEDLRVGYHILKNANMLPRSWS